MARLQRVGAMEIGLGPRMQLVLSHDYITFMGDLLAARTYPNFDAGTYLFWRTKIKNHISGLEKMEPQGFVLW
ncbi:hypothetical protein MGG_17518 [Pyricularia oryzae 70-15]|uniref:Uncharacterized protein n=1 Tax=Pyricularia oryzae (strain 70-15 / ATCC MYA-4617 / FGSC 8958) TaxID=242507 RepID=G4NDX4_PYRO7|nr:uncharacterized protein MGG_17518 [Pyricularia oryzae 70-15]EHA49356.1 hypothetical protein MGG_17518 [Pyricularia oryzae 70-15]